MTLIPSLILALAIAPTPQAAPADAAETCPEPRRAGPAYPADKLRANVSGTAVVKARIDSCGRVIEPVILESSGHRDLDEAALDAVRLWVLNEDERRQVGGEWVNLPVAFGGARTVVPRRADWPRSHRRPLYLPDPSDIGFASIAEFKAASPVRSDTVLVSPYKPVWNRKSGMRTWTNFQQDLEDARTFWLTYIVQLQPAANAPRGTRAVANIVAVARYRLVEEDGVAVVRVALLCEESPEACDDLRGFLMQGLPIAKPPRG